MGPVEKCLRDSGIDKRNVHDVALIVGSARIPIVQKMIQEFFTELIVLSQHTHRDRFADELGKQNYVTGEMWKDKSLFRLAVKNGELLTTGTASPALHWPWSHEAPGVWYDIGRGYGSTCLEDVGIDRNPHQTSLKSAQDHVRAVPGVS